MTIKNIIFFAAASLLVCASPAFANSNTAKVVAQEKASLQRTANNDWANAEALSRFINAPNGASQAVKNRAIATRNQLVNAAVKAQQEANALTGRTSLY